MNSGEDNMLIVISKGQNCVHISGHETPEEAQDWLVDVFESDQVIAIEAVSFSEDRQGNSHVLDAIAATAVDSESLGGALEQLVKQAYLLGRRHERDAQSR